MVVCRATMFLPMSPLLELARLFSMLQLQPAGIAMDFWSLDASQELVPQPTAFMPFDAQKLMYLSMLALSLFQPVVAGNLTSSKGLLSLEPPVFSLIFLI